MDSKAFEEPAQRPCGCTKKRAGCALLSIAGIGIAAYFIKANIPGVTRAEGWLWPDEDPFDGDVFAWSSAYTSGTGLSLKIINALEEKWDTYFDISVVDWEQGTPDVLTLRPQSVSYDPDCNSSPGTIRVCNNNYGDTGWKGQNSVLLRDNKIHASVSLMNDYYLDSSTPEDREYTMCHELGHALGLPHTDERFWNIDQGNCMDYTSRPGNNKKPGRASFERLALVYDPPTSINRNSNTNTWIANAAATTTSFENENIDVEDPAILDTVLNMFNEATTASNEDGTSEEFEMVEIGAGYSVLIHRMNI